MPRRGEHVRQQEPQPALPHDAPADDIQHVGTRVLTSQRHGQLRTIHIYPGGYACAALAAQLADELIAYARVAALRDPDGLAVAVRSFLQFTSERVLAEGT